MNLPLFVAKRYFFSKKSQRAINIISIISVIGVMIGTGALVVVLSVFNGFESLVVSLYNSFDPELKVTVAEGKTFPVDSSVIYQIKNIEGVKAVSQTLEENALVKYRDKQYIITIKGVDENFQKVSGIDSMIIDGNFKLQHGDTAFAVVGGAIAYNLQLSMSNFLAQIELYVPQKNVSSLSNPEVAFNRRLIIPAGIFGIQQEFDNKYILVPLSFARDILDDIQNVSALEVSMMPGTNIDRIQQQIKDKVGSKFNVDTRLQQHATIYRIMKSEKWAVFLILAFILLIATFNVIGSLTMLIIEKGKDISILYSMGADAPLIRKIFLMEGLMITFIGSVIGIVLGVFICFLQVQFKLVKLTGSGSFVIDAYPVEMQPLDFLYVFIVVALIGFIAAWYPAKKLVERKINLQAVTLDE
jgi:lipoprotein-releasing system permease protein